MTLRAGIAAIVLLVAAPAFAQQFQIQKATGASAGCQDDL
jgi:hypothetical protein